MLRGWAAAGVNGRKMLDTLSGLKQGTRCWARDLEIGLDVLTLGFSQRDQPTNKPPNNTNKP
jgi:hypothetical protein